MREAPFHTYEDDVNDDEIESLIHFREAEWEERYREEAA